MYMVVSRWRMLPGKEEVARERGLKMRRLLRGQPGIEFVKVARTDDGEAIVMMGYSDRATYDGLINDPNGIFATAAKENELEQAMEWIESWRGEAEEE